MTFGLIKNLGGSNVFYYVAKYIRIHCLQLICILREWVYPALFYRSVGVFPSSNWEEIRIEKNDTYSYYVYFTGVNLITCIFERGQQTNYNIFSLENTSNFFLNRNPHRSLDPRGITVVPPLNHKLKLYKYIKTSKSL